jgi:hypothetical protein
MAFMILSFHYACDHAQGLGGGHGELRDADPPVDAAGQEVSHAFIEDTQAHEESERDRRAAGEEEMEWGATLPPRLPLIWLLPCPDTWLPYR